MTIKEKVKKNLFFFQQSHDNTLTHACRLILIKVNAAQQATCCNKKQNAPHNSNWRLSSQLIQYSPRSQVCISRLSHNKPCDWANENEGEEIAAREEKKLKIQLLRRELPGARMLLPTYIFYILKLLRYKRESNIFGVLSLLVGSRKWRKERTVSLKNYMIERASDALLRSMSRSRTCARRRSWWARRAGHHTHGMAQLSQRIVCRILNEKMMSKEYLINEAHQLDHQTTILNKLDCVRIRCREEEEAERETHNKKKSKPSSIHIQIGWAHQPPPLHTSLFNNYLYVVQSSAETNNKNIKLIRPCPSCSRVATIWLLMMMAQEIIVIILFRKDEKTIAET